MTWETIRNNYPDMPSLEITASDLNPENLKRAQKGVYEASSFKETSLDIQDRFFEKIPGRNAWAVKSYLKTGVTWNTFHLLHDQPIKDAYDIIFLRNNILLYTVNDLKLAGLKNIVSALTDTGILIIGAKDTLPEGFSGLKRSEVPYVLKKYHGA